MRLQCNIYRRKGNTTTPTSFTVHMERNERFLMAAMKKPKTLNPNYSISLSNNDFDDSSKSYIGKVKSNMMGTMFDIWDSGKKIENATSDNEVRKSRGCVTYVLNFFIEESEFVWVEWPKKNEGLFTQLRPLLINIVICSQANYFLAVNVFKFLFKI